MQVSVSGRGEPATFAEEEEEAAYADEEEAKEPLERLNRPTSSSQFPVPKQQAAAMRLLGAARPDSAVVLSPPQPPSPVKRTRTSQLSAGESPPAAAPAASSSSSGATGARTRHASPPKLPRAETFEPYRFPEGVLPFRGVSVTVRSPAHQVCFDRRLRVGVEAHAAVSPRPPNLSYLYRGLHARHESLGVVRRCSRAVLCHRVPNPSRPRILNTAEAARRRTWARRHARSWWGLHTCVLRAS